ncbi:uncharacterized protein [Nicotiana sylvestris]|uniref:uncharacterized protein n=1 Tax=Nicotiana sylvestris TaxID=4096 RepID=UPI00388C68BE
MEHLHPAAMFEKDVIDHYLRDRVKCIEHKMTFDKFALPLGVQAWVDYLGSLTKEKILWSYLWIDLDVILAGSHVQDFLVLIGLWCTRPYTPARVMRQLGRQQEVSYILDSRDFTREFDTMPHREIDIQTYWRHAMKMGRDTLATDPHSPGLRQLDALRPIESKIPNPPSKNLDYALRCAYCSNAPGHDIDKCWHLKRAIQELIDTNQIVVQSPNAPNINHNPLLAYEETHMIEIVHKDGEPKKSSKFVMMIWASESNLVKVPNSTKANPLTVEGATEKPSSLNLNPYVLVVKGPSKDIGASPKSSKVLVPGIPSKSVIVVKGDPITPIIIKPVTQLPVIDAKDVPWNYKQVIVTYKGKEIEKEVNETGGLTRSGRCFTSEELRKAKPFMDSQMPINKSVTEEEAEDFLKKMKVQDYSIVEQLKKTPTHISLLSLLIHSDEHRKVLMKILNEAHVPDKIIVNHLEKIASKIFEVNRITFSDDELPMEGTKHNRALYLTVKCEDSIVSRVLVDNGSSANICPLSTLQKLKIGTERIHLNNVCVRGFDGGCKHYVGDIMLELSIGPVEFTMEFQVLDVAVSYNLLLGRP